MTSFQVSPGVQFTEFDQKRIAPTIATTPGGFAGTFQWGPVLERVLIDSENNLVSRFGKPNDDTAVSFFVSASFLAYGSALNVVRVVGEDAANATSSTTNTFDGDGIETDFTLDFEPISVDTITVTVGGTTQTPTTDYTVSGTTLTFTSAPATGTDNITVVEKQLIKNEDDFDNIVGLPSSAYARYPGALGNSLKVILADSTSFSSLSDAEQAIFEDTPTGQEIHFAVIDEDGSFTGTAGTLLEIKQFLSKTDNTFYSDGTVKYYKKYINQSSKYVFVTDLDDFSAGAVSLTNGVSDDTVADADIQSGYTLFANADEIDVSLIVGGDVSAANAAWINSNISTVRRDCVAFFSPELDDVVNNSGSEVDDIKTYRTTIGSTSYGVLDSGWKQMYDRYNDVKRWVPLNGDTAGLCVKTDDLAEPWFSPAGLNRGQIKNVIKLAWNPTKAQRDELYKSSINPVVTFQGEGTLLYGDKTLLTRPGSFDRINVRRLFIVLEKTIATAAKYTLFELNDEFTRLQFRQTVEPFLRDVQGRRGIYDFNVVCNEDNNTEQVRSEHRFVGDIYVSPAESINYIQLNFIATETGVIFDEINN